MTYQRYGKTSCKIKPNCNFCSFSRYLELFPNGNDKEDKGFLGIFLCLQSAYGNGCILKLLSKIFDVECSSCLNFTAKINFGIVSRSGAVNVLNEYVIRGSEFEGGRGSPRFFRHDRLVGKKSFVPDKKLTISCEVKTNLREVVVVNFDLQFQVSLYEIPKPPPLQTLLSIQNDENYKKIFKSKADSDLELKMKNGKTLKAHKKVLVKNSPDFFLAIDPQNGKALISDFDSKTIEEVLRFVYYGEVKDLKKIVYDLIVAADKYQIAQLKEICSDFIISKLKADNVVEALAAVERMKEAKKLLEKCSEIVDK